MWPRAHPASLIRRLARDGRVMDALENEPLVRGASHASRRASSTSTAASLALACGASRRQARWVLLTIAAVLLGFTIAAAPFTERDVPDVMRNSLGDRLRRSLSQIRHVRVVRAGKRSARRSARRATADAESSVFPSLGVERPHMRVPPLDGSLQRLISDIDHTAPFPRDASCEVKFKSPTGALCHCDATNAGDTSGPAIARAVAQYHFGGCVADGLPERATSCFGAEEGECLIVIGSVITKAKRGDHVWGTGAWHERDMRDAWKHDGAVIHGVRGPGTASILNNAYLSEENDALNAPAIGDPGFLVSFTHGYLKDSAAPRGYCFIAHHYDDTVAPTHVRTITTHSGWEVMVKSILDCEYIFTSSLHGLIFAESFGVKARWYQAPDGAVAKNEGRWKYHDWIKSTPRAPQWLEPAPDINQIFDPSAYPQPFTMDERRALARRLVERFPYEMFEVVKTGQSLF